MRREPCFREHAPGVATDCKSLPSLDQVVTVELERVGLLGKRSFVKDSLAVILARCLEAIELEQPIGGGEEFRRAQFLLHLVIFEGRDQRLLLSHTANQEGAGGWEGALPLRSASSSLVVSVPIWRIYYRFPVTCDGGRHELGPR
jgi:hypothetical protein